MKYYWRRKFRWIITFIFVFCKYPRATLQVFSKYRKESSQLYQGTEKLSLVIQYYCLLGIVCTHIYNNILEYIHTHIYI